jgi:uncharacterized metal-binding protein YceD (DUF177 family)
MGAFRDYDIEFIKLKEGEHRFEYQLTDSFFKAFNSSLSTQDIRVDLLFTKSGSMFTLDFEINGHVEVDCDRCLTRISLPISDQHRVLVKLTEYPMESEDDLVYISSHDYKLNIAQHIFDFVNVSIPIKNTCADVGLVCDPAVTQKITSTIDVDVAEFDIPERDTDDEEE